MRGQSKPAVIVHLRDIARSQARVEQLEGAIRKHQAQRREAKLPRHVIDRELYAMLPEGVDLSMDEESAIRDVLSRPILRPIPHSAETLIPVGPRKASRHDRDLSDEQVRQIAVGLAAVVR